jgi:hypothetical protein
LIEGKHIDWLVWHEEKEGFMFKFKSREEDLLRMAVILKKWKMEIAKGNGL